MKISFIIQHLTFLGVLHIGGSDAVENFLELKLWNNHMLRADFRLMPETRVVPRPVPDWMRSRPREITTVEVFINDHSERYYKATASDRNLDRTDPGATPQQAFIRFKIQNWEASNFNPHPRPNLITSSHMMRDFSPVTIDTIYVMVLNGDIYSSKMEYRSTDQNAGPILGRPIVSGLLRDAPRVHGHLLGGEAIGSPPFHGTVTGTTDFPDVPSDHTNALFSTGIIYQGRMEETPRHIIPSWLRYWATRTENRKAFIRHRSGRNFETEFIRIIHSNPTPDPNSSISMPKYAEIHFPSERLVAKNFKWYEPSYNDPISSKKINDNSPTKGMIYVLMPSGNVYESKLEDWQPVIHPTNR